MKAYFGELELKYYGGVSDEYALNAANESLDNAISQANSIINKANKEPLDKYILNDLKVLVASAENADRTSKAVLDATVEELSACVNQAKASVALYKNVKTYVDKAEALDADGQSAFAAFKAAYNNGEVDTDGVSEFAEAYITAVKSQTTPETNMTEAMPETWEGQTGIFAQAYPEAYSGTSFPAAKILYQRIEGLTPGEYEVKFIAVASLADWVGQTGFGNDIAQIYVNDDAYGIEVFLQRDCDPTSFVRSYIATVGEDGVLEYGIQNIAEGGCWYVAQALSLKYKGVAGTTAIEDVKTSTTVSAGKFVENGQVVIVKNGAKFNVNGVRK
jgi:hypothetical protein